MKPWLRSYKADVRSGCPRIPDGSVDVAFFSPPYKKKDGYDDALMLALGRLLARVMAPGGRVWLNFGQLREQLDRPQVAARLIETGANTYAQKHGQHHALLPGQTIAWVKSIAVPSWRESVLELMKSFAAMPQWDRTVIKRVLSMLKAPGRITQRGHYQPINSDHVMHYCWEPLFTFYKPPEPVLDRLSIGVPFTDKSNTTRGTRGQHGDIHCPGDAWFIPYSTTGQQTKKKHKYEFPEALVERALKVSGVKPGMTVFDPFFGSGTTACVAKRLGANCYGMDLDPVALKGARLRWSRT